MMCWQSGALAGDRIVYIRIRAWVLKFHVLKTWGSGGKPAAPCIVNPGCRWGWIISMFGYEPLRLILINTCAFRVELLDVDISAAVSYPGGSVLKFWLLFFCVCIQFIQASDGIVF
jgi:hypothetical protein